mmetsp:Transcript_15615/g.46078  ORF Transcript_15615/g.46078 Transcript_15615/m.46078 type:complete len:93 (-) Transcript_15615:444-722(-)
MVCVHHTNQPTNFHAHVYGHGRHAAWLAVRMAHAASLNARSARRAWRVSAWRVRARRPHVHGAHTCMACKCMALTGALLTFCSVCAVAPQQR